MYVVAPDTRYSFPPGPFHVGRQRVLHMESSICGDCRGGAGRCAQQKINLNCRDGSSGHDSIFFGIIPPPLGVATVVPVNFG